MPVPKLNAYSDHYQRDQRLARGPTAPVLPASKIFFTERVLVTVKVHQRR
jgi:hypothetical protein